MLSLRFTQRWLLVMCAASIVIGVLLIVAGDAPFMRAYNDNVAAAFNVTLSDGAMAQHRWALGVTGAGTVGWSITLLFVVAGPFARAERWAFRAIAVSVAVWIALDIALSLYWGVLAEVLFAASAGIGFAVPLAFSHRHFRAISSAS